MTEMRRLIALCSLHEGRDASLYHTTELTLARQIVQAGYLRAGRIYGQSAQQHGHLVGISATRNPRLWFANSGGYGTGEVAFVLDQRRIAQRYRILPISDAEPEIAEPEGLGLRIEAEELILAPRLPLQYVSEIWTMETGFGDDAFEADLIGLKTDAEKRGIAVRFDMRNPLLRGW